MFELNNFESIQIGLSSPEKIRAWSRGEVTKPETINYRTLKPERDGLFCERIFGPVRDWECACGKYKKDKSKHRGIVCDKCGVEVTSSKVRREKMGHIELATPVSHIWYFKGVPSRMGILLDMSPKDLEKVLYFAAYLVVDPGETNLLENQIINDNEYYEAIEAYGEDSFVAGMGAEYVKMALQKLDLEELSKRLSAEYKEATGQKKVKLIRRLEIVESFRKSGNDPVWMVLEAVPVIPPDLRPMVQLDGGRFATSDLNDLYRRVINRNNRLNKLLELGAPDIIVRNEKRMLQEAVDSLIDNGRRGKPVTGPGNRPLKSLSDLLKGKQGRFRQNLLGKRVDYSGRSVIVVGPNLKFNQCGLPKKMALEMFKPHVMHELVERGISHNVKAAKKKVEKMEPEVWPILEDVVKGHPVMLNRAPTLHRLGIQAFEPVLIDGKAIQLHPLACTAYNADFDGDQMAVHLPLSVEAIYECNDMLLSTNNILAPKDGSPITTPTQDMILGSYYLTREDEKAKGTGLIFKDYDEMITAYENGAVDLHARVKVRSKRTSSDPGQLVSSTVGRFIFNSRIPQDLGYVDRDKDKYALEVDFLLDKKALGDIIDKCFRRHGNDVCAIMLDNIKNLGFRYSTKSGISVSVSDMQIPEAKYELIAETEKKIESYEKSFRRGLMSDDERYEKVIAAWTKTTDDVTEKLMENLDPLNNINVMAQSGARGSKNQIKQLAGMRGLMADATGKTVEIPVKSNFREGLSILEYFTSSHGARKGLADTALRTADSGYLTRRLVDVSQDVIISTEDCGTKEGLEVSTIIDGSEVIEELYDRIVGRTALEDIIHPKEKTMIVPAGEMIVEELAKKIIEAGIEKVKIRTPMDCKCEHGICAKCYGRNLATGKPVPLGEAVGIIAAQSIGEPGTQLTMRTFHTGGIAGGDITQGLPRVEELFEARKPKGLATITEVDGIVSIIEEGKKKTVIVTDEEGFEHEYVIPYGSMLRVKEGQKIKAADPLTQGSINPHDILRIIGVSGVQAYIVKEVQRVYKLQGVDINDKHIEIIVRQMLQKVKIEEPGDTEYLPAATVDKIKVMTENEFLEEQGLEPAVFSRMLQGITKAALSTDSFLSSSSFQETTKVLTDAAIKGDKDGLKGLKENVIIGKLIPAGSVYRRKMKSLEQSEILNGEEKPTIEEIIEENEEYSEKIAEKETTDDVKDSEEIILEEEEELV